MNIFSFVIATLSIGAASAASYFIPEPIPVARVKQNLEARLGEDGADWQAHYQLGRLHTMVAVLGCETVVAIVDEHRANVSGVKTQSHRVETHEISHEERVTQFNSAIEHMRAAYILRRQSAAVALSYAYLLDQAAPFKQELTERPLRDSLMLSTGLTATMLSEQLMVYFRDDTQDVDSIDRFLSIANISETACDRVWQTLRGMATEDQSAKRRAKAQRALDLLWQRVVLDLYYEACVLGSKHDLGGSLSGFGPDGLVTVEAAEEFERLVKKWGREKQDQYRLAVVRKASEQAIRVPRMVTPIIFSLNKPASLESLLAPETTVPFDLDGTGRDQAWPWVSAETAILVWDPEESGEITSGRQLFGSVSWWLFFDDGYRALDALDDNRDGELAGDELPGLAVWTDANSNGVSDPGEVVPIAKTGIEAISCRQTDTELGMPANYSGLRMTDGRVLPTYDWVAESAPTHQADIKHEVSR